MHGDERQGKDDGEGGPRPVGGRTPVWYHAPGAWLVMPCVAPIEHVGGNDV